MGFPHGQQSHDETNIQRGKKIASMKKRSRSNEINGDDRSWTMLRDGDMTRTIQLPCALKTSFISWGIGMIDELGCGTFVSLVFEDRVRRDRTLHSLRRLKSNLNSNPRDKWGIEMVGNKKYLNNDEGGWAKAWPKCNSTEKFKQHRLKLPSQDYSQPHLMNIPPTLTSNHHNLSYKPPNPQNADINPIPPIAPTARTRNTHPDNNPINTIPPKPILPTSNNSRNSHHTWSCHLRIVTSRQHLWLP